MLSTTNKRSFGNKSKKAILKCLDFNARFEIVTSCPALRAIDREVRMPSIDTITFEPMEVKVDGTVYQVGIVSRNLEGPTPDFILQGNAQGGCRNDVDEYGLRDMSGEYELTPGDVKVPVSRSHRDIDAALRTPETLQMMRKQLKDLKLQLESLEGRNPELEKEIAMQRTMISFHSGYHNGRPGNYENLIQVTITEPDGERRVRQMKYSKKLHQAMKDLTTKLFGRRRQTLKVRCLDVSGAGERVIRLPEGLKLDVKELIVGDGVNEMLEALSPIIQDSKLEILVCSSICLRDLDNEILRNVPILSAKSVSSVSTDREWLSIFKRLQNPVVIIKQNLKELPIAAYILLIYHFLENGKANGSKLWFGIIDGQLLEKIKKSVKDEFGGLAIRMLNGCVLRLNFEETTAEFIEEGVAPWIFKMDVSN